MKDKDNFGFREHFLVSPLGSHTTGAVRLGNIARELLDRDFNRVIFYLQSLFKETVDECYTDKALVAGILGISPSDDMVLNSFEIAKNQGIDFAFKDTDLEYQYPCSVKIVFEFEDTENIYIIGSSLGDGNILITDINGNKVEFSGNYPTILVKYADKKGVISEITTILAKNEINIASMKVTRDKDIATMIVETDSNIEENVVESIGNLEDIIYIKGIVPFLI
ncbi:MAG: L-serine ammonia-lyase, iron-sulfur-dependent subunit beta [Tissierellaceae bacterium]